MSVAGNSGKLSWLEQLLSYVTRVRAGEGRAAAMFFLHGFLLQCSFQMVKALRESFILTKFSAAQRSYVVACVALLLMLIVPLYGWVRRHLDGAQLLRVVTIFFMVTLPVFAVLHHAGVTIAIPFYMWVSIYGLMVVAQMWAYAADSFNVKSGQRLFVVIMLGANIGALVGAKLTGITAESLTHIGLMIIATCCLGATLLLARPERAAVPEDSRPNRTEKFVPPPPRLLGGIGLVLRDRYLLMIALFMLMLNLINSNGEFILGDYVKAHAAATVADPAERSLFIASFYGNFNFWVTLISLGVQVLLVSRIYQLVGVRGALLFHPLLLLAGYGLLAFAPLVGGFVPIFSIVRRIKVADNGLDYSLMNTTRQSLFLPLDRNSKYDGKMAIDTFFVRCGDVLTAVTVFIGSALSWASHQYALLNVVLCLVWMLLALAMGRIYARKALEIVGNHAPEAVEPIPDLHCAPGRAFRHEISRGAFHDADPGDVLVFRAMCDDGKPLPRWLKFDARSQTFSGTMPAQATLDQLCIAVVASDMDGLKARNTFTLRRVAGSV